MNSRGRRTQARADERRAAKEQRQGAKKMVVPDHIKALTERKGER